MLMEYGVFKEFCGVYMEQWPMEVYFYLISRFLIYKKLWEKDDDSDVEENE